MKTTVHAGHRLMAAVLLLLVFVPLPVVAATATAIAIRDCTVQEVLKGGMYVYIRCQEGSAEVWLATVDRSFKPGEEISFLDVPPMTDFYSKFLNRTFPAVILTEVRKAEDKVPAAPVSP